MSDFENPDDKKSVLQFPKDKFTIPVQEDAPDLPSTEKITNISSLAEARERAHQIAARLKSPPEEMFTPVEPLHEEILRKELIEGMVAAGISEEKADEIFDNAAISVRSLEFGIDRRGRPEFQSQTNDDKLDQHQRDWEAALKKFGSEYPHARKMWYQSFESSSAKQTQAAKIEKSNPAARLSDWIYENTFLRGAKALVTLIDSWKSLKK